MKPPAKHLGQGRFDQAVRDEQLHELEQLWYRSGDEHGKFARQLLHLVERLGEKYQVDELAAKYEFTGRTPMTVPQALQIKQELEQIDKLLKQLEEAMKTAQIGIIDMEALAEFAEPGDVEQLSALQQQIQDYLREVAERQGLEQAARGGFQMTPKAYRLFQSRLLTDLFSEMQASRSGRHQGPIIGEGATEMQQTKTYEFGDSVTHMDMPASLVNAMIRNGPGLPVRLKPEDIEIHKTRNNPKCATAVLLDMSGSMRYDGQYVMDGQAQWAWPTGRADPHRIPGRFPAVHRDVHLREAATHVSEVAGGSCAKPVTIYDPIVRLQADMSDPNVSEMQIPPHFTNIQHGLQLARKFLATQDTPNRQVMLITDGLPTAHFEGEMLYLLYPPDPRTEQEATPLHSRHWLCAREGITINIFLLSSWNQSEEDVPAFAYRMAESTKGRSLLHRPDASWTAVTSCGTTSCWRKQIIAARQLEYGRPAR